eukprot:1115913-Pleurochrysis_carterae.AAC.1
MRLQPPNSAPHCILPNDAGNGQGLSLSHRIGLSSSKAVAADNTNMERSFYMDASTTSSDADAD